MRRVNMSRAGLSPRSIMAVVVTVWLTLANVTLGELPAVGQVKRAMTPEDIVALRRASDAQVSGDGRRVVYVLTSWDREEDRYNPDLWLVTESRQNIRLTNQPGRDDHPRWAPDGSRIAFLSERGGAPGAGAQIYLLDARIGGEAVALTSHPTPIERFEWSSDGRYLAFLAAAPVKDEPARRPGRVPPPLIVDGPDRPHQLWVVEMATGRIEPLTTGARHISAFGWSPDGTRVVIAARPDSGLLAVSETELYLLKVAERGPAGEWRFITTNTSAARPLIQRPGAESDPRFSPDGRSISYLAKADGDPLVGPDRIHIISAPDGPAPEGQSPPVKPEVLLPDFDGYIRSHRWVFDNDQIIFSAGHGVNQQLYSISRSEFEFQALTRTDGHNSGFSITPDGQTIAFVHENPRQPGEVALLSARIMVPIFLTDLNPQSREFALGQVEAVRWRGRDGTWIEGLLVYPTAPSAPAPAGTTAPSGLETGRRYPLVTILHGGPEGAFTKGFEANWSAFPHLYAAQGYAVFLPNFRGSSNYGARFAQSNAGLAGRIDVEDILGGIDHLIRLGIADGSRLGVVGWSYGGYLSGLLIGQTTRFRAAAWGAGLANATSYWGTADIVAQRERLHGGTPWEAARIYDSASPLTYFRKVRTPVLLFHGAKDRRVPLTQSEESYRRLRRLGVNVQMIVYPEQGHALEVPSYQIDKIRREFEWIAKHLLN